MSQGNESLDPFGNNIKEEHKEKSDFSVCQEFENMMQLSDHERMQSPNPSSKKTANKEGNNSPISEDYEINPLRIEHKKSSGSKGNKKKSPAIDIESEKEIIDPKVEMVSSNNSFDILNNDI